MPASLEELGDDIFDECYLDSIDMSKVTQLSAIPQGFNGSKTMIIPEGVTIIEENAIWNCEKIFLPSSLRSVSNGWISSFSHIYLFAPQFDDLDNLLSNGDIMGNILYVLPEYLDSYKTQWEALGKPNPNSEIDVMPDEYRYLYDN